MAVETVLAVLGYRRRKYFWCLLRPSAEKSGEHFLFVGCFESKIPMHNAASAFVGILISGPFSGRPGGSFSQHSCVCFCPGRGL